jgi:hypothetical protein
MAKYAPLEQHLLGLDRAIEHPLSFARIEQILGSPLPPSARAHQAWWANQRGAGHSQAHSWMGAGWHTRDLDLETRRVTFKPVAMAREPAHRLRQAAAIRPLSIEEAKAGIALRLGIDPADIKVTLRRRGSA